MFSAYTRLENVRSFNSALEHAMKLILKCVSLSSMFFLFLNVVMH